MLNRIRRLVFALALATAPASAVAQAPVPAGGAVPSGGVFKIVFDPELQKEAYAGRVYVAFSTREGGQPRMAMGNWGVPTQTIAMDVSGAKGSVTITGTNLGNPKKMTEIAPGEYFVQAVARRSLDNPRPGAGPGDLYSKVVKVEFKPGDAGVIELNLTEVVTPRPFSETDRVKLVEIVSPSLSKFHGREYKIHAGVYLPANYKDDGSVKYPAVYEVTGFGGDHNSARRPPIPADAPEVLYIVPDATCRDGHSVFADSGNTGPWGKALIEELIPEIEKRYHGPQSGAHRYVTGVSSGGWSSLWLQVAYPEAFNGCYSHCPDPVDFRDFQQINLYHDGENMYTDAKGALRPLSRGRGGGGIVYREFVAMETVLGPGGQIHSFEAVFSKRGSDGQPQQVFDRATGKVNTSVSKDWERYDIRLVMERNWPTLGPKLKGKIHVYAGEIDTFYLEGAARLLKESLAKLGSDAEVEIIPGMVHTRYGRGNQAMYKQIAADGKP